MQFILIAIYFNYYRGKDCIEKLCKSLKAPFAIYLDLECLLKNVQSSQNNPEKSHTEKKLDMKLLVEHCLQDVHLIKKKINLIITDEKIVLKNYVKS